MDYLFFFSRSLERIWSFMDMGCSENFRLLACGYYLPKCSGDSTEVQLPCKGTCNRAKRRCAREMKRLGSKWPREFKCNRLKLGRTRQCIKPVAEIAPGSIPRHSYCIENTMPMCQNMLFNAGSLPNMFLQRTQGEIQAEMEQYRPLVETGCSADLAFFLCGTYMPYCVRSIQNPYALPCRELCESVKRDCEVDYRRLYGNLPWSLKFQCHRFPESTDSRQTCVVPTDLQLVPRRRHYQLTEAADALDGLADRMFMVETDGVDDEVVEI
jgi:hypothetical protein